MGILSGLLKGIKNDESSKDTNASNERNKAYSYLLDKIGNKEVIVY